MDSFVAFPSALIGVASPSETTLLIALQAHQPRIFPSYRRLQQFTGMSERHIRSTLAGMVRKGWIERLARFRGDGGQGSNGYRILVWGDPLMERSPSGQPLEGEACRILAEQLAGGLDIAETVTTPRHVVPPPRHTEHPPRHVVPPIKKPLDLEEDLSSLEVSSLSFNSLSTSKDKSVTTMRETISPEPMAACDERTVATAMGDRERRNSLPACAEPHRAMVERWWRNRARRHPKAPKALDAQTITAIEAAHHAGVLQAFLAEAAERDWQSLGYRYRQRIEVLLAGEHREGFEDFATSYLRAENRASGQSKPLALAEWSKLLRDGEQPERIMAGLRAELAHQKRLAREGGWSASLPAMARWLRERRYDAYAAPTTPDGSGAPSRGTQGPVSQSGVSAEVRQRLAAAGVPGFADP